MGAVADGGGTTRGVSGGTEMGRMPYKVPCKQQCRVPSGVLFAALLAAGVSAMGDGPRPARAAEAPHAAASTSSGALQQAGASQLQRLPPLSGGSRLWGEQASVSAPVYLTRREADAKTRFRLGSLSSVSVLPESGTLTVSINGVNIRDVPVGAAYGLRLTEFEVPAGLLREGWNAVGIAAHHRHRVDCSVDAAEELWTRVDPAETGFLFADDTAGLSDLADVAAIGPRPDGAVPIGVMLDANRRLTTQDVERLGRAVQGVALAGRFVQPLVEFEDSGDAGLDLVLGTVTDIAGRVDRATLDKITGPTIAMLPAAEHRRPTIVVTGLTDAELDAAIANLAMVSPVGSPQGLNTLAGASGHRIGAYGQSLTFSDLGIETQELMGRTLRLEFSAALPEDFLPADYDRVALDFSGGYAAGLGADAQIVVGVNGRNAGSIRLASAGGDSFRHKRHFLPLSVFRPGQNRVEMRVNAPDGRGADCDNSASAATRPRVWLSGTTKVTFPSVARVGRLPDLAFTSSGAFPFAGVDEKTTLVVPTPDRATLGAALTIVARLGLAAGKQIPFAFATSLPADAPGNVLIVSPARALDPALMRQARLDPDLVQQAWSQLADLAPAPVPVSRSALRRRAYEGDWPDACAMGRQNPPEPVPEQAKEKVADVTGAVRTDGGSGRFVRLIAAARRMIGADAGTDPQAQAASLHLLSGASLVVAQGVREGAAGSVVTIVSSPNAAMLNSSVSCLVEPSVWSRLSGELSALDATTGAIATSEPETRHYVATQDFSIHNGRLLMAGWLSLNPRIFILIAFLLALPLAATTHFLVRNVGRRNP
jgi:cellulose synthase operon protein B